VSTLVLSACVEEPIAVIDEQVDEYYTTIAEIVAVEDSESEQIDEYFETAIVIMEKDDASEHIESLPSDAIGGDYRECFFHTYTFCGGWIFDIFIGEKIVSFEDFSDWVIPLRAMRSSPYDECLVNIVTFLEHFNISREALQLVIDGLHPFSWTHINLDVLYSGDWDLINQYYHIENQELHSQLTEERREQYFSERMMDLQQIVNDNVSGQYSIYFHDVWTFTNSLSYLSKNRAIKWMEDLIAAGEYDKVNIVEFTNFVVTASAGWNREAFERRLVEFDMHLFTHYNPNVIFSRDPALIKNYYSIENEPVHTMLIETAFDEYVTVHGMPDTSWMLD